MKSGHLLFVFYEKFNYSSPALWEHHFHKASFEGYSLKPYKEVSDYVPNTQTVYHGCGERAF